VIYFLQQSERYALFENLSGQLLTPQKPDVACIHPRLFLESSMTDQVDPMLQFTPGAVKTATKGFQSNDLWKIPPQQLRIAKGFNVRVRDDAYIARVRAYADAMKDPEQGFHRDKPLSGYVARENGEDFIIVTDGHTRLEAVLLAISEGADIQTVPVITKPNGTSMEDLTCALVTGNSGQPLSPYEIALVCKRLINYGWDEDQIAQRLKYTETYVQSLLLLVAAPAPVRAMVQEGSVSASLAIDTLRKHGSEAPNLLKEGLMTAVAAGKARVTKKQMQDAPSTKGSPVSFRAPKRVFERAATWVQEQKLDADDRFLDLLAFLGGIDVEGVRKKLTTLAKVGPEGKSDGASDGSPSQA
jgi:ParB-like chromosome segregation protein Spo0J